LVDPLRKYLAFTFFRNIISESHADALGGNWDFHSKVFSCEQSELKKQSNILANGYRSFITSYPKYSF
jgi:hypothetical protein